MTDKSNLKKGSKVAKKEEKAAKKAAKKADKEASPSFKRVIIGLLLLSVFVSITYMTVLVWGGTDTRAPKIWTLPAAGFNVVIAFIAFSKILK